MTEQIVGYINDYAPLVLMLVFMFIDRFGFGNIFSAFRKDIVSSFNVTKLTDSINALKAELASSLQENNDIREELTKIREQLAKVKGAKNEQRNKAV